MKSYECLQKDYEKILQVAKFQKNLADNRYLEIKNLNAKILDLSGQLDLYFQMFGKLSLSIDGILTFSNLNNLKYFSKEFLIMLFESIDGIIKIRYEEAFDENIESKDLAIKYLNYIQDDIDFLRKLYLTEGEK